MAMAHQATSGAPRQIRSVKMNLPPIHNSRSTSHDRGDAIFIEKKTPRRRPAGHLGAYKTLSSSSRSGHHACLPATDN
jgi:hypothetical protein